MMIKKGIDELTGEQYYVLVNDSDNSISRLSSEYKSNEIELFKKIVSFKGILKHKYISSY